MEINDKINISEKFKLFGDHWSPKIVGELNGQYIKLVKFQGEFVWHKHEKEDEMFMVVDGEFDMHFRGKKVRIKKGEFIIVPMGIEHRPCAENEVQVMLFEPKTTINTGNIIDVFTVNKLDSI